MIDSLKNDRAFELLAEDMFKQKSKDDREQALDELLKYAWTKQNGRMVVPEGFEVYPKDEPEPKKSPVKQPTGPKTDALQDLIEKAREACKTIGNAQFKTIENKAVPNSQFKLIYPSLPKGFVLQNPTYKGNDMTVDITRG